MGIMVQLVSSLSGSTLQHAAAGSMVLEHLMRATRWDGRKAIQSWIEIPQVVAGGILVARFVHNCDAPQFGNFLQAVYSGVPLVCKVIEVLGPDNWREKAYQIDKSLMVGTKFFLLFSSIFHLAVASKQQGLLVAELGLSLYSAVRFLVVQRREWTGDQSIGEGWIHYLPY